MVSEMQDGDDAQIIEVIEEVPQRDATKELEEEKLREELAELRKTPMNSSTVVEMSSAELASVLAAFVMRYEVEMIGEFEDMKRRPCSTACSSPMIATPENRGSSLTAANSNARVGCSPSDVDVRRK